LSTPSVEAMSEITEEGGSPRLAKSLSECAITVLAAQTLTIPATIEFGRVIAGAAPQLRDASADRAGLAADLEARREGPPPSGLDPELHAGLRTATKILTIVGDGSAFPTTGHLAAYADLASPPADPPCAAPFGLRVRAAGKASNPSLFRGALGGASARPPSSYPQWVHVKRWISFGSLECCTLAPDSDTAALQVS
jgi:hypothetical protein